VTLYQTSVALGIGYIHTDIARISNNGLAAKQAANATHNEAIRRRWVDAFKLPQKPLAHYHMLGNDLVR
jgi:hypothetical protein